MLRNEPFEKLPLSYRPAKKFDHYPPRLSFGFAIPKEFARFRQVALENNLGDPEEIRTARNFFEVQTLVIPFLNKRSGLSPEEGIICGRVHSLEATLVLELGSNYLERVPKEKIGVAVCVIREVFHFPDDARPKWYLEGEIDLKDPDEYLLPSESRFSTTAWGKI